MGIDRETFYGNPAIGVASMAFCYPGTVKGADLPPPARCAAMWRKDLMAALPEMQLTLLIGRPAHIWALEKAAEPSMDAQVRGWRKHLPSVLCLPHPSWRNTGWLNRNPWFEDEVTPYLRGRVAAMVGS